uniref:Uncharacterized protein n=1 Tax=Anopheles farauti TaxID=69004 RepID=A0A182QHP2_9DIPT
MVLMVELGREQRGVLVAGSVAMSVTLDGDTDGERAGAVDAPLDVGDDVGTPLPASLLRTGVPGTSGTAMGLVVLLVVLVLVGWVGGAAVGVGLRPKKSDLALLCTERRSGMLSSKRNCMSGNWMTRPLPPPEDDDDVEYRLSYRLSGRSPLAGATGDRCSCGCRECDTTAAGLLLLLIRHHLPVHLHDLRVEGGRGGSATTAECRIRL